MPDEVVLVNSSGQVLRDPDGSPVTMDKIEAHVRAVMHEAVSVFVFNDRLEMLLQKRAAGKYHSPLRWSNACCTHTLPGETPARAARRRLEEEMGLSLPVTEVSSFSYCSPVGGGFFEHEFDHVFFGFSDRDPMINPSEASDWRWTAISDLRAELEVQPESFTAWLPFALASTADIDPAAFRR